MSVVSSYGLLFLWVSCYMLFVKCQKCRIDARTELEGLWYLKNNNGYDMNVMPAWEDCKTGAGVIVGVVDTGVQDHYDLNINRKYSNKYVEDSSAKMTRQRNQWSRNNFPNYHSNGRYNYQDFGQSVRPPNQMSRNNFPNYHSNGRYNYQAFGQSFRPPKQVSRNNFPHHYSNGPYRYPYVSQNFRPRNQGSRNNFPHHYSNGPYRYPYVSQSFRPRNQGSGVSYRFPYSSRQKRNTDENRRHGTRVAGIIAARKNRRGIIGIAFEAQIADIRIASGSVFKTFKSSLLYHQHLFIDIYSCSLTNSHTGSKSYPLLKNQEEAFKKGITEGRKGRGSIYVFATGNMGGSWFPDSCAYDRLITNRYVISVAGIQHNLRKIESGESCSAIMVAAFTASASSTYKVRTLDIRNGTTNNFNQNSAAVPMVSGAIALALNANPRLSYRDIMHLIVNTARSNFRDEVFQSHFKTNAAGFRVSSEFGFGLLDIGSLVKRSKKWRNVPSLKICKKSWNRYSSNIQRNMFQVERDCDVTYIEHVEVTLNVHHRNAGKIKWELISPSGTHSTILPGRVLDRSSSMNITVMTVQLWGENPIGWWGLTATLSGKTMEMGTLTSADLTIYGYLLASSQGCSDDSKYCKQWLTYHGTCERFNKVCMKTCGLC